MARVLLLFNLFCVSILISQTRLDLSKQSKNVDFRAAVSTAPVQMGTLLPSSCVLGEFFFLTGIAEGGLLHVCTNPNIWTDLKASLPAGGGTGHVLTKDSGLASWAAITGDVSGFPGPLRVTALRERPLSTTVPQVGQALVWTGQQWSPVTVNGAPGTLALESNGVVAGTRGVHNMVPGFGLLTLITDTGTKLNIQQAVDPAVILSRAEYQTSQALQCNSSGNSASSYSCTMSPTLMQYGSGMVFYWKPDVDGAGGATTLAIDSLTAKDLKLQDGITNPRSRDILAGQLYPVWYDGTVFRMLGVMLGTIPGQQPRPVCTVDYRGQLWLTGGNTGAKDTVAVCAKDANDAYGWQVLYE
jgi:hypothetical protein